MLKTIWLPVLLLTGAMITSAQAEKYLSACDFISKSEVERLLGHHVGDPIVAASPDVYVGWFESANTSFCDFALTKTATEQDDSFRLGVYFPPFSAPEKDLASDLRRMWASGIGSQNEFVEDIPGFDGPAIYYYRADTGQSMFEVFSKRHVIFAVRQFGVFDQHRAFAAAVGAAHIVANRYAAMPVARLKDAFQLETWDEHPWHP